MKVVILAGGLGTRLAEETDIKPKPMVEVGGHPILWHIMRYYAHYGFKEFVVALGYKGEYIKRFFLDYQRLNGSMTVDLKNGKVDMNGHERVDWTVHLVDTGLSTQTGGRIKRLEEVIGAEPFLVTYGDGLANVDVTRLVEFHQSHGALATVTAVRPPSRFGGLILDEQKVTAFDEKPQVGEGWINGGFLVFEPDVFRYLDNDKTSLEADALQGIARDGHLRAFRHEGFWQCMDTLREVRLLQDLWGRGEAPWKLWQ